MTASDQSGGGTVRKHFYLVTEHEDEDRVGGVSIMDSRMSRPLKNKEGPITVLDEDKDGFRDVGKKVGMGYYDFESEDAYEDDEQCVEVMKQKLAEIDEQWLRKAGLDPQEVLPS
jgi:hypothetical protein